MFGDQKFLNWFTSEIQNRFKCKEFTENTAEFLGMTLNKFLCKETGEPKLTMDANDYEKNISEVELTPDREIQEDSPLTEEEEAAFRNMLGKLMWLCRLTRPALSFESAAAAQKYDEGVSIESEYNLEDIVSESLGKAPVSKHEAMPSVDQAEASEDDYSHMEGFANFCLEEQVNKINMYRQKKAPPETCHLKIKNVKFSNKAIRKCTCEKKL